MKVTKRQKTALFSAILVAAALTLTAYGAYQRGYRHGQKDEAAKKTKTLSLDDAFAETTEYFRRSVQGTIVNIDGDTVVIKQSNNQERRLTTTDKTTVVGKSKDMKLSDLKKDQRISVLISELNKSEAARITIK